VQQNQKHVT